MGNFRLMRELLLMVQVRAEPDIEGSEDQCVSGYQRKQGNRAQGWNEENRKSQ